MKTAFYSMSELTVSFAGGITFRFRKLAVTIRIKPFQHFRPLLLRKLSVPAPLRFIVRTAQTASTFLRRSINTRLHSGDQKSRQDICAFSHGNLLFCASRFQNHATIPVVFLRHPSYRPNLSGT